MCSIPHEVSTFLRGLPLNEWGLAVQAMTMALVQHRPDLRGWCDHEGSWWRYHGGRYFCDGVPSDWVTKNFLSALLEYGKATDGHGDRWTFDDRTNCFRLDTDDALPWFTRDAANNLLALAN